MTTLLHVTLTPDQHNLLTAIAQPWIETGEWPLWANVQHEFDLRGQDADAVFHSLPRMGSHWPYASGYGYTAPMRAPIDPGHRVRLTVAGASRLPKVRIAVGEPFMRTLRHMIDLYTSRPILADEVPTVILRSGELAAAQPDLEPWFVKALPDLLSYEPAISTGGAHLGEGSWEREVTRSVLQFRGMHSVEEYIEKTCEIVAATAAQFVSTAAFVEEEQAPAVVPARGPYVDDALLDELEKASQITAWNLDRLIALCRELNHSYTADMPHASAAMIRAILDHIPPAFQHQDFKSVAAQHPFGKTDKAYARDLVSSKSVADDALHRQIGKSSTVLVMDDLPGPARLRAMLRELLTLL
ncbi:hypothetical protein [Streptomyces bottropensis]|uniref:hypothetical protein n=1 Tax=Streptomyces bottropensis TaxID=42235 RepID=UPI0036A0AA24